MCGPIPELTFQSPPDVGGSIGAARHTARWDDFSQGAIPPGAQNAGGCIFDCASNLTNDVGFIGGGQIGYNWQSGSFVYGIEADISGLAAKFDTDWRPDRGNPSIVSTHSVDWLATIRGRAGLAVDRTLLYVTAGVAFGGVNNRVHAFCNVQAGGGQCNPADTETVLSNDETRVGWVAGGGIEHALTYNWTVRGEVLYVDLGQSDKINTVSGGGDQYSGRFSNELVIARVGFNYKW